MAISSRVFGTTELLESILLHLDFASLTRCFGVCRHFKDTIDGSKSLQKILWLIADTKDYTKDIDVITERGRRIPEMLAADSLSASTETAIHEFLQDHLHPVFGGLVIDGVNARHELSFYGGGTDRYLIIANLNNSEVNTLCRLKELPASWKQMRIMEDIIGDKDYFSINCHMCLRCQETGGLRVAMTHHDSLYDAVKKLQHLRLRSRGERYGCCKDLGMFLSWLHKMD